MSDAITFDEITHTYSRNGKIVRSWSSICRTAEEACRALYTVDHFGFVPNFDGVDPYVLANAKARGLQCSDAYDLIMEGQYEPWHEGQLPGDAKPYVAGFQDFWTKYNPEGAIRVQQPAYCAKLDFCTTIDWVHDGIVWDNKSTSECSRTWGLQIAAALLANPDAHDGAIWWARPKLKSRQYEIHRMSEGNPKIFSRWDLQVAEALALGNYEADCIPRWRNGE